MDLDDVWREDGEMDPYERVERMMGSIMAGGDPEESDLVRNPEERALWRRLARSIATLQREGVEIVYSVPDDDADDV